MGKEILYVGRADESTRLLQTTLEDRGYGFLHSCDPAEVAELLRTKQMYAVCVNSQVMYDAAGETISGSLKLVVPHTPVVLIQSSGNLLPPHFEEHADVVTDETSFLNFGHRMIDELRQAKFPVFVQWIEDWKQRSAA